MLPTKIQRALASRYTGGHVRKAFDKTLLEGFQAEFAGEREQDSAAIYIDVAGFSRKVDGLGAAEVRAFLDAYYESVLPPVFELGGMIDRIAGDGIIAIFSPVFGIASAKVAEDKALTAAETVVRGLHGTPAAAKAAVGAGSLLFCKTGVAQVYEEFTVIGTLLTELYRIEEIALEDEVVLRADSALGQRTLEELQRQNKQRERGDREPFSTGWSIRTENITLRGVSNDTSVPLLRQKLVV